MSDDPRKYRFRSDEGLGEAARRVATRRVESALEQLRRTSASDDEATAEAVHEARKDLKKTRSVLRLVREGLERERYREQNARLRDAGRGLAGARDAEVKLATIRALAEADPDALTPQLRERLVAGLEAERDEHVDPEDLAPRVEEAQGELEQSRLEIAGWELDGDWKTVSAGLERSYGRGREALGQVRETPDDDATVHEWRKRVKDLWYQLRLLRDSWEGVIAATVDELDRLSDLLGEHHDLAVLAEDVEARMPQPDGDAAQLVKAAGRRQRELLAEALPVGERIYTESPRRFSKRVGSYWEAWRSEESEPDGWA